MSSPAVHFNLQWSAPLVCLMWDEGPSGIVRYLRKAKGLGYGVGLWRFPNQTSRVQAHYGAWSPWKVQLAELRKSISTFADENDFEAIAYMPPNPRTEHAEEINTFVQDGYSLAWDMIGDQNAESGLLQRSYNARMPWNLCEPWYGSSDEHGAFYGCRCVVTWTEYLNRLAPGKRLDEGPMPTVYIQPDEKWPHIGSRNGLVEFCSAIATDDRPDARRLPMLPLDVVVGQSFDARPYMRTPIVDPPPHKENDDGN